MHRLTFASLALLASAACQKESTSSETPPTPSPEPVPTKVAEVSISSVTVQQDCPDPKPEPEAEPAMEEAKSATMTKAAAMAEEADEDVAEGDSEFGYAPPCVQSMMQISITGQGKNSSKFAVKEVRLLGPNDKKLTVVPTRAPSIWKDNTYAAWDETVAPSTDVKASYKLGFRSWYEVEKALGGSSYGPMFVIEADVSIDGVAKTIRSASIVREPEEMVET